MKGVLRFFLTVNLSFSLVAFVNERDRATGELIVGQAASVAPLLPPDAQCLACGGLTRLDQVRTLRNAGYDGFVIGRALLGDPRDAEALMRAISDEPVLQRVSEIIKVPVRTMPGESADLDLVSIDQPQERGPLPFDA